MPSRAYRSPSRLKDLAKRASVEVARRSPVSGDARSGGRHRHLGRTAGNERGKDHTDGSPAPIADVACEQKPGSITDAPRSGCDARIGWLEAETVSTLDRVSYLVQRAHQVQEFSRAAASGEATPEALPGLRAQRRGYQEASPLEVEGRIHAQDVLAHTRRVVHLLAEHSSDTVHISLHAERR